MKSAERTVLRLRLPATQFFPGQVVRGVAELSPADVAFPVELVFEFTGCEKTFQAEAFIDRSKLNKNDRKDYQQRTVFVVAVKRQSFEAASFEPPTLSSPFELELNQNLPPSFAHSCRTKSIQFSGNIQYKVVGKLFDKSKRLIGVSKARLQVFSDVPSPAYPSQIQSGHVYKTFGGVFSDKNITLGLRVGPKGVSLDDPNQVDIEIDATHAKSSLVNVKLQLLNFVVIRNNSKSTVCRRLVCEFKVADLLPKKTNYSGNQRLVVSIPPSQLTKVQQTVSSSMVSNLFALRLSVDKNHGPGVFEFGVKPTDLLLPVFVRRTKLPAKVELDPGCSSQLSIKDYDIEKLDAEIMKMVELESGGAALFRPSQPRQRSKSSFNNAVGSSRTLSQNKGPEILDISIPVRTDGLEKYKRNTDNPHSKSKGQASPFDFQK